MTRRASNRLYDSGTGGAVIALKADLLFKSAMDTLIREGYTNTAEAIYDAVYSKLNEIQGDRTYPSLEAFKEKKSKEEQEMERALINLKGFRSRLGVMKAHD